jgi:hypothetical protein
LALRRAGDESTPRLAESPDRDSLATSLGGVAGRFVEPGIDGVDESDRVGGIDLVDDVPAMCVVVELLTLVDTQRS